MGSLPLGSLSVGRMDMLAREIWVLVNFLKGLFEVFLALFVSICSYNFLLFQEREVADTEEADTPC